MRSSTKTELSVYKILVYKGRVIWEKPTNRARNMPLNSELLNPKDSLSCPSLGLCTSDIFWSAKNITQKIPIGCYSYLAITAKYCELWNDACMSPFSKVNIYFRVLAVVGY